MTCSARRQAALLVALAVVMNAPASGQTLDQERFVSTFAPEELRDKQAVIDTDLGPIVLDLLADVAPNHVGLFVTLAVDGAFDGTTFHRMVARGVISGRGPLDEGPFLVPMFTAAVG